MSQGRRRLPQCGKMTEFDIAIVGSSLFSGLLAGVLARDHGRKVVRIGRRPSSQRLPRRLELALPLATRPETWRLCRGAESETQTLLGSIGVPEALTVVESALIADLPASQVALDHIAHLAAGYHHQVRRIPNGWSFRRIAMLDREMIEARLDDWLKAAGVTAKDEGAADASLTVLSDDAAMFDWLPEAERPPTLISQAMMATLVVSRPLPVTAQRFIDRGVTLLNRPGNTVLALVSGEADAEARLASTLTGPFPMKRLATTRYRRFVTSDGAPIIGRLESQPHFVVSGLGDVAAFLVPAISRLIAGAARTDEASWFALHDPSQPRAAAAEFVADAEVAP